MIKPHRISKLTILLASIAVILLCFPSAYADTDGTELRITDQPEKLIIQLGAEWAGAEFRLKTDAGVYQQPIAVTSEGILSMEIGGSKTYTLSAITVPTTALPLVSDLPDIIPPEEDESFEEEKTRDLIQGIPNAHLFVFTGGILFCILSLVVLQILKNRRDKYDEDEDDISN